MMIMEKLEPRQKQEWKPSLNDHWIRTGCRDLWDAVFLAFRDYRDGSPSRQWEIIQEKTQWGSSKEWVSSFYKILQSEHESKDEQEITGAFFYLLPLKLIKTELVPYLLNYMEEMRTMEQFQEEILDKCLLLVKYRQKKKNWEDENLETQVREYLQGILKRIQFISYEDVRKGMFHLEHQLIILSTEEKVLFDTKTEDSIYQDVLLVLAHPDGTYDSIGRLSYTKDGNQKISRLFHYDDPMIEALRSSTTTEE